MEDYTCYSTALSTHTCPVLSNTTETPQHHMLPIDICTIGVKGLWSGHTVCIESLEKLSSE